MNRKPVSHSKTILYFFGAAAIILVTTLILVINNSYKNKGEEYLTTIPDRVSSKQLAQELKQISDNVRYFKASKNKIIEYPEHFKNHFTLIPYKESFGTNISYIPASSCIAFNSKLNQTDALNILEDITRLGFYGGYVIDKETIARDLGGDSYKFYSFSRSNRELTINNTDSEYKLRARACLEEQ